jgi:hypothetical protein
MGTSSSLTRSEAPNRQGTGGLQNEERSCDSGPGVSEGVRVEGIGRSIAWETDCDCIYVKPAVIQTGGWDTQRRVLETKGNGKQAEKFGVEMSGGHTGGRRTRGVDPYISKKDVNVVTMTRPGNRQKQQTGPEPWKSKLHTTRARESALHGYHVHFISSLMTSLFLLFRGSQAQSAFVFLGVLEEVHAPRTHPRCLNAFVTMHAFGRCNFWLGFSCKLESHQSGRW